MAASARHASTKATAPESARAQASRPPLRVQMAAEPPPPAKAENGPPAAPARGTVPLFDIGCNLLDDMFHGTYRGKAFHEPDVDRILQRAADAGVRELLVTATSLADARRAVQFVRDMRGRSPVRLACTVGVHPTRCNAFEKGEGGAPPTTVDALLEVARDGMADGTVAAVGEIGLDFDRLQFCPRAVQERWFVAQLAMAKETGLPLFLHNRNTSGVFAGTLRKHRDLVPAGGVVHSFDGSPAELGELLEMGLYLGLNGCSLRTPDNLATAVQVPLVRLLLETDAPWCQIKRTHAGYHHVETHFDEVKKEKWEPASCVKTRNEPCHCIQVLEVVAKAKGESIEKVGKAAYENARTLFAADAWGAKRKSA